MYVTTLSAALVHRLVMRRSGTTKTDIGLTTRLWEHSSVFLNPSKVAKHDRRQVLREDLAGVSNTCASVTKRGKRFDARNGIESGNISIDSLILRDEYRQCMTYVEAVVRLRVFYEEIDNNAAIAVV